MKDLPLLLDALFLLSCTDDNPPRHMTGNQSAANPAMDYLVMRHGSMMRSTNGHLSPLTSNLSLSNGTVGMPNGTCRRNDGTVLQLQEGQRMMLDGRMLTSGHLPGGTMPMGKTSQVNHQDLLLGG